MRASTLTALGLGTLLLQPLRASAQCPSQSACPNPCTMCRVAPAAGSNPSTAELASLFDRIAAGPAEYGSLGWNFGSANTLSSGSGWCGAGGTMARVPAHFPCTLLKAIYVTESNWRQFCSSGLTVVSFDCGYGIAQVTSGMRPGETSAYDPLRVAAEPAYNVSVGAKILRDKWEAAPCVGENDPDVLENWYFAVWGYNGFAFKNNPNNPMYPADRAEYRTPGVASAAVRGNYPYQEVVFGYLHYPPSTSHYTGIAVGYPARSEICTTCGLPSANVADPPVTHRDLCNPAPPADVLDVVDAVVLPDAQRQDIVLLDLVDTEPQRPDVRDAGQGVDATVDVGPNQDADTLVRGGCGCRIPASERPGRGPAWAVTVLGLLLRLSAARRAARGANAKS